MTTFYLDPEGGDDLGSDFSIYGRVPAHNTISSVAVGKYGGRSISTAAGTGSYMSFANQTANGMQVGAFKFTAEAWVYFTSHNAAKEEPIMGQWNTTSASNRVWQVGMNASGQLQYQWSTSGTAAAGTLTYNWTPTLNQWYHIAFDRDGTTARLYIDGVVVASVAEALVSLFSTTINMFVGGDNSGQRNFPGYIQDARLTKGMARYAGAFTPPSGPLPIGYPADPYWHYVYMLVPGRMDGTGTSFAQRWRSVENGATAARTAPGDIIRIRATPDPTLVGNATWTQNSSTLTLASAVNATIDNCDAVWTGATNVTATAQTGTIRRQGTGYAQIAVAAAFTTGKMAYKATGLLDLSSYQQVSFWFQCNNSFNSGQFRLCLCSDTTGDTVIQSFVLPDFYSWAGRWLPLVFDTGAALPSNVQSVALYADVDPGTATFLLDNIVACKASSDPASITHRSLIGKVHNLSWTATTAYSLNDRRRPTQVNRNGFAYQVTTAGTSGATEPSWPAAWGKTVTDGTVVWTCIANELEDSWFGITGISGATLTLDNYPSDSFTQLRGYHGASETVATYKREPVNPWPLGSNFSSSNNVRKSGSAGLPITYSGGWDRTDMSVLNAETWWDGVNGNCNGINIGSFKFIALDHFNAVRYNSAIVGTSGSGTISHCHANNSSYGFDFGSTQGLWTFNGIHGFNNSNSGVTSANSAAMYGKAIQGSSGGTGSVGVGVQLARYKTRVSYVVARNNWQTGIGSYAYNIYDAIVYNYATSGNAQSVSTGQSDANPICFVNGSTTEANFVNTASMNGGYSDSMVYSHKHGGDAFDHRVYFAEGTIRTDLVQRHTASGLAWKCNLFSTARHSGYPVRFSLGRYLLQANVTKTFKVWSRRDVTTMKGALLIYGGSLAGIEVDATVSTDPSTLNTWEQSAGLTVTPLETGVVELWMLWWDGVGTASNYWIDDLTVT
jgi:hypothetical protein